MSIVSILSRSLFWALYPSVYRFKCNWAKTLFLLVRSCDLHSDFTVHDFSLHEVTDVKLQWERAYQHFYIWQDPSVLNQHVLNNIRPRLLARNQLSLKKQNKQYEWMSEPSMSVTVPRTSTENTLHHITPHSLRDRDYIWTVFVLYIRVFILLYDLEL